MEVLPAEEIKLATHESRLPVVVPAKLLYLNAWDDSTLTRSGYDATYGCTANALFIARDGIIAA